VSHVYPQYEFCTRKRDIQKGEKIMKTFSPRTTTLVASVLGALVLAFPARSDAHHYDDDWNPGAWQGVWHEREELDQVRDAQQRDWQRLQHEQREMNEARRAGDWY